MPKPNFYALKARSNPVQVWHVTDENAPGQTMSFAAKKLDLCSTHAKVSIAEDLKQDYVGDPAKKPLPAISDADGMMTVIPVSEALCETISLLLAMQVPHPDADEYSAEDLFLCSMLMENALSQIALNCIRLNEAPAAPKNSTEAEKSSPDSASTSSEPLPNSSTGETLNSAVSTNA